MYRPSMRAMRQDTPVENAVMVINNLTTQREFRAFFTSDLLGDDPTAPQSSATTTEERRREMGAPEDVRLCLLSEVVRNKETFSEVLDANLVAEVCYTHDLLKWIFVGFDQRLIGQLDAKLQAAKINLEEFGFGRLGYRPAIKANGAFLVLGDVQLPYNKGYMPHIPW